LPLLLLVLFLVLYRSPRSWKLMSRRPCC
jgi:hypothetical protein